MSQPVIIGQDEYRAVWTRSVNELIGVVVFQDKNMRYVPGFIWAADFKQCRGKQTFEKLIEAQRAAFNLVAAIGWQLHEDAIHGGLAVKEGDQEGMVPLVAPISPGVSIIIPGGSTQQ